MSTATINVSRNRQRHLEIISIQRAKFKDYLASKGYTWGVVPFFRPKAERWNDIYRREWRLFGRIPLNAVLLCTGFNRGLPVLPKLSPVEELEKIAPWALADLRRSGLTDAYIDECGSYRAEVDHRTIASWLKNSRRGKKFIQGKINGRPRVVHRSIVRKVTEALHKKCRDAGPWMKIIYHDPERNWSDWQTRYKPANPWLNNKGEEAKYLSAVGSKNRLYVPNCGVTKAHWDDANVPIIITEGEKKADAANQAGFCCVAIAGVWAWVARLKNGDREWIDVIGDIAKVFRRGRTVLVTFDSDLATNPNVGAALNRLVDIAHDNYACDARIIFLPGGGPCGHDKVGLDDFLLTHGASALTKLLSTAKQPKRHVPMRQVGRCSLCIGGPPCNGCKLRVLNTDWYYGDRAEDEPEAPSFNCPSKIPIPLEHKVLAGVFRRTCVDCGRWTCPACAAKNAFNYCVNLERRIFEPDGSKKLEHLHYATVPAEDYESFRGNALSRHKAGYYAILDQSGHYHVYADRPFRYQKRGSPWPIVSTPIDSTDAYREVCRRCSSLGSWKRPKDLSPVCHSNNWSFEDEPIKSDLWRKMLDADTSMDQYDWKNIAEELGGEVVETPGTLIDMSEAFGRARRVSSLWTFRIPSERAGEFRSRIALPEDFFATNDENGAAESSQNPQEPDPAAQTTRFVEDSIADCTTNRGTDPPNTTRQDSLFG